MGIVKTMDDWKRSFDKDFKAGDLVSEEIAMTFANAVSPISFRSDFIQCGEAYSTIDGRQTYATFKKINDGIWLYCGNCHIGKDKEAES